METIKSDALVTAEVKKQRSKEVKKLIYFNILFIRKETFKYDNAKY